MADAGRLGRSNQKRRTRRALLDAASQLMRQGHTPSLEEIAEEALVSRATAYRYFPSAEALLVEASLDLAMPDAEELFRGVPSDLAARVKRLDAAVDAMIRANEPALRAMLINALQLSLAADARDLPARQNRRSPLIEAALEPARDVIEPESFDRLGKALALVVGTEARVVCKDVLQLSEAETRALKSWMIGALVAAAGKS